MAFGEFDDSSLVNLSSYVPNGGMERDKEAIVIASADDIFTLCWTSGTTGVPKGVPRSHNHW
jgi:long-subunit acyl-CoA synthetase (AMP-forming)